MTVDVPAYHAPAKTVTPPAASAQSHLTSAFHLGAGVGVGTPGAIAGAVHLGFDLFPFRYLGFGLEGVLTGSQTITIGTADGSDSQYAARLRAVGQFLFHRRVGLLTSVGVGVGGYHGSKMVECTDIEPDSPVSSYCNLGGGARTTVRQELDGIAVSYSAEVAPIIHFSQADLVVALRLDGTGDEVATLSLGPGVRFVW